MRLADLLYGVFCYFDELLQNLNQGRAQLVSWMTALGCMVQMMLVGVVVVFVGWEDLWHVVWCAVY